MPGRVFILIFDSIRLLLCANTWRHTCCLALLGGQLLAVQPADAGGSFDLKMEIDGTRRVAKVFENDDPSDLPLPLVFAFHGYDDNRTNFSRYVDLHRSWPGAIIVYPQGLQMPDRKGTLRAKGWQTSQGMLDDRDLHYVDALLEDLSHRYSIDVQRVYATGMSNGARFVFLLMSERPERFAAFAPVAIAATSQVLGNLNVPRPVLYMIGRNEPQWRLEAASLTVEAITRVNRSTGEKEDWAENFILFKPAEGGADFIFNLHRAGHVWPFNASELIMRFFQQHELSGNG